MRKVNLLNIVKYTLLGIFVLVIIIFPFYLLLINSFKTVAEGSSISINLPSQWSIIENYRTVFIKGNVLRGLLNTVITVIFSVSLLVLFGTMAAWVFARSKTRFIKVFYFISISGVLIAPAIITSIKVFLFLKIYGNLFGLTLFYIGIFMSFSIFYLTGFVKNIPIELEEAARIDGCNNRGVFFRIILPLMSPVLVPVVSLLTLFVWSDFIYPFYFLAETKYHTLTLGLYNVVSSYLYQVRWNLVCAEIIMISLPLIIIYFFFQKRITKGFLDGALKG